MNSTTCERHRLAQIKDGCLDSRLKERGSVLARGESGDPFEGSGEVTLVGEPAGQRDVGELCVGFDDFTAGVLDSQPPQILHNAALVVGAKDRREVDRVNTDSPGQPANRQLLIEVCVKHGPGLLDPAG